MPVARPALLRASVLALLLAALHAGSLAGPLRDGQGGNCAAMFSIMARNGEHLGWLATRGVPVLNPVPPEAGQPLVPYAHHPPGLPWLVAAAGALPVAQHTVERMLALLLTLTTVLLGASLAERVADARAGWVAGLALIAMPSGVLHGLLVNYETVALPCVAGLGGALLLGRPGLRGWALAAALADWIALLPIVLAAPFAPRRRTATALAFGGSVALAALVHGRLLGAGTTGETLAQALAATFLGPEFSLDAWLGAWRRDAGTLFGAALPLAAFAFMGGTPERRRLLGVLLGVGLLNVTLFAHHASSHEHFWLLFAPFVAVGIGCLGFPHARRSLAQGAAVAALLVASAWVGGGLGEPASRNSHVQSDRGRAFATATADHPSAVHVTPRGVPLVFLEAAVRHVLAQGVSNADQARRAAVVYATRLGLGSPPVRVFLRADEHAPDWLAALGAGQSHGGFRFWDLPR